MIEQNTLTQDPKDLILQKYIDTLNKAYSPSVFNALPLGIVNTTSSGLSDVDTASIMADAINYSKTNGSIVSDTPIPEGDISDMELEAVNAIMPKLQEFEGFSPTIYNDPAGVKKGIYMPRVGYGMDNKELLDYAKKHGSITREMADEALQNRLHKTIRDNPKLFNYIFNIKDENLRFILANVTSDWLYNAGSINPKYQKKLLEGDIQGYVNGYKATATVNGEPDAGLRKRRSNILNYRRKKENNNG